MDDAGNGRRGLRPRISPALNEAVEHAYGVSLSSAFDLGGSVNLNLHVPADDAGVVVRVYRHHVTEGRLDGIQGARAVLSDGGVPCAVALRTRDGGWHVRVGEHLVEVEPFFDSRSPMDSVERVAAGLPTLGRIHDLLAGFGLGTVTDRAPTFANYVDPTGLADATRGGTERIRSWKPTAIEVELADAADRLAFECVQAQEEVNLPERQLVHGDYWDNNVGFRGAEIAWVGDFDFMGERLRVDDVALTLSFAASAQGGLDLKAWRQLATLVDRYDAGTSRPLTATERAALPVAVARQSLWPIAVWAAHLDDIDTARRHVGNHLASVLQGRTILARLDEYQAAVA